MPALYRIGSSVLLAGAKAYGLKINSIGHEHIPSTGPAVLAINHISYVDFAFAALAPPMPRREVRFMARQEFFKQPAIGWFLRGVDQISVDVHGDATQAALDAEEALKSGEIVGLHPEGTISPSFVPRRAKSGAVRLAEAAGAPIIPVAVWGSQRVFTKGRPLKPTRGAWVTVRYGQPYEPQGRTAMARTKDLMGRITDLVAQNQREYPQRPLPPPDDWWQPAHLGGNAPTPEAAEQALREQDERRKAARSTS